MPDNISILYSTLNFGSLRLCSSTPCPDGLVDIITASLIYVCTVQLCCLLLQNTPYLFIIFLIANSQPSDSTYCDSFTLRCVHFILNFL